MSRFLATRQAQAMKLDPGLYWCRFSHSLKYTSCVSSSASAADGA